jgi:predicted DsbA family dithiol-disulfide isomerase
VERLFRLYFFDGADIGDGEVLVQAAKDSGLDETAARDCLANNTGLEAAQAEDMQARRAGIQGVPTFILNGRYSLSGAQEPEVLFQLFDVAREESKEAAS